jgi:hypothetical protein
MKGIVLIAGIILMILGAFIKPADKSIEFDRWLGWCGNSTVLGKIVYFIGVIIFLGVLIPWIQAF